MLIGLLAMLRCLCFWPSYFYIQAQNTIIVLIHYRGSCAVQLIFHRHIANWLILDAAIKIISGQILVA